MNVCYDKEQMHTFLGAAAKVSKEYPVVVSQFLQNAKEIEFDDSFIYDQLALPYEERSIKCDHIMRDQALKVFKKWKEKDDKIPY